MTRRLFVIALGAVLTVHTAARSQQPARDISPAAWPQGEYQRFLAAQDVDRTTAGVATGTNGAVTVAYNGIAARAGLAALERGGNAMDAALTTAVTQVAVTAGAPISYFGILSLVYYDAKSGQVFTMNAEWNTVRGDTEPATIPGSINLASPAGMRGTAVSGRTALVGGFLKGVGAAHQRFGRLPFARIFDTAIHVAEQGMPVTRRLEEKFDFRREDLARLPETRATFLKPDGAIFRAGEIFKQPALGRTLRAVAEQGTDYIYKGPWARKLVAAIQADGGKMTLDDLASYDVIWDAPLVADFGPYRIMTNPPPNAGGVNMIEALRLAEASGLTKGPHWTKAGPSLKTALDITQLYTLGYLPDAVTSKMFPGVDFTPAGRTDAARAAELWKRAAAGAAPFRWKPPAGSHSDDVVAVDKDGNMAAITHSSRREQRLDRLLIQPLRDEAHDGVRRRAPPERRS